MKAKDFLPLLEINNIDDLSVDGRYFLVLNCIIILVVPYLYLMVFSASSKILSIILLLSMLISNVGLSIGMHKCMGRIVETQISMGEQLAGCSMKVIPNTSADSECVPVLSKKKSCCDDNYLKLTTDHPKLNATEIQISPVFFSYFGISIISCIQHNFSITNNLSSQIAARAIPLLNIDLQLLLQVFII